jgi:hypothetical protein
VTEIANASGTDQPTICGSISRATCGHSSTNAGNQSVGRLRRKLTIGRQARPPRMPERPQLAPHPTKGDQRDEREPRRSDGAGRIRSVTVRHIPMPLEVADQRFGAGGTPWNKACAQHRKLGRQVTSLATSTGDPTSIPSFRCLRHTGCSNLYHPIVNASD